MGGVCRRQGEHACGIVYTLSRDDSEVVAAYLRVPPTLHMRWELAQA